MSRDIMNPNRNSNKVRVIGKISDINFRQGKNKNNQDYISYTMHVRVNQSIAGQPETSEVEVSGYASKLTKEGTLNNFYTTIDNLRNLKTIEKYGLEDADVIRITSGKLQDNTYPHKVTKQIIKSFRVDNSTFFEKGNPTDIETAEVICDAFVMNMTDETDAAGDLTGRVVVKAATARWGGSIDIFDFIVEEPSLVERIQNNWNIGDTVSLKAHIRIAKKEVAQPVAEETDVWGEDFGSGARTITVRELVVTGAKPAYPEENAYDASDMRKANNNYKAQLEQKVADLSGKKVATRSNGWDD